MNKPEAVSVDLKRIRLAGLAKSEHSQHEFSLPINSPKKDASPIAQPDSLQTGDLQENNPEPIQSRKDHFERKVISDLPDIEIGAKPSQLNQVNDGTCSQKSSFGKIYEEAEKFDKWTGSEVDGVRRNLTYTYFEEYGDSDNFKKFILKLEDFMHRMLTSNYAKFFNIRSNLIKAEEKYIEAQDITLLGRQYFQLLDEYSTPIAIDENSSRTYHDEFVWQMSHHAYRMLAYDIFRFINNKESCPTLYNVDQTADGLFRTIATVAISHELNLKAKEIKQLIKDFKNKTQNYDRCMDLLDAQQIRKVFDKTRILVRLSLDDVDVNHSDLNRLNKLFADFIKRIKGNTRVSPDIEYLRLIRIKNLEQMSEYFNIDVLCFIEPTDKFYTNDDLIKELKDHWVKTISHFLGTPDGKKVQHIANSCKTFQVELMQSQTMLKQTSLFIEPCDKEKIEMVISKLIPSFIGQAIYRPVESLPKSMRQLQGSRAFSRTSQTLIEHSIVSNHKKNGQKTKT